MIISSYNAFQVLPEDSWAGVTLIFLALVLAMVDLMVTNHGLPTAGGRVALILGVLLLFNTLAPFLWALLIPLVAVAILAGVLFVGALSKVRAPKERPVATGVEGMIGEVGVVKELVGVSSPGWIICARGVVAGDRRDRTGRRLRARPRAGDKGRVQGAGCGFARRESHGGAI